MRQLFTAAVAASLSVGAACPGWAQPTRPAPTNPEPARLQLAPNHVVGAVSLSSNQQLAEAVADTLKRSSVLKHFRVNISADAGQVDLTGTVETLAQRGEVLRLAQAVPGVVRVNDRLQVIAMGELLAVAMPPQPPAAGDLPKAIGKPKEEPGVVPPGVIPPAPMPPGIPPLPLPPAGTAPGAGGILEPMPMNGAPPGFPSATQPPPLPPYAWPTYAPYNNYSRVAYPNLYPYESFPFIGPVYPFPKVPLGWRSVSLTWEDGHWWLGRNATGHDWWRIRYW